MAEFRSCVLGLLYKFKSVIDIADTISIQDEEFIFWAYYGLTNDLISTCLDN